jgi:oligoribonuclease NrnB/cAMP/cGMP phosphodiesterase (DHH superfamily)
MRKLINKYKKGVVLSNELLKIKENSLGRDGDRFYQIGLCMGDGSLFGFIIN